MTASLTAVDPRHERFGDSARREKSEPRARLESRKLRRDDRCIGEPRHRFTEEIKHFLAAVAAGQAPSPTGEDGLRALKILEAAYRAAGSAGCSSVPD